MSKLTIVQKRNYIAKVKGRTEEVKVTSKQGTAGYRCRVRSTGDLVMLHAADFVREAGELRKATIVGVAEVFTMSGVAVPEVDTGTDDPDHSLAYALEPFQGQRVKITIEEAGSEDVTARTHYFWQVLEVYNKKVFRRDEILKEIARNARYSKKPTDDDIEQLAKLENWLQRFEQATLTTSMDIEF